MSSGVGLYCQRDGTKVTVLLGEYATVFQAELVAIIKCVQNLLESDAIGRRIKICLDSQAALKVLESPRVNSQLARDCKCVLNELAKNNDVGLILVFGHLGIKSKKRADLLSRETAETRLLGPEPAV